MRKKILRLTVIATAMTNGNRYFSSRKNFSLFGCLMNFTGLNGWSRRRKR